MQPGDVDRLGQAVVSGGAQQAIQSAPAGARDVVAEAAQRAFIDGINDLFIIAALVAFTGALCALALVRSSDIMVPGPPADAPAGEPERTAV